jgi:SAM-dependent methyltransferase
MEDCMTPDMATTGQKWSEHTAKLCGRNSGLSWWEAGPQINQHINYCISGNPDVEWTNYSVGRFAGKLPLERCLSLGCGSGALERDLARLEVFQQCDAYDLAEGSIQTAKTLAEVAGIYSVSYYAADINKLELPANTYDSVWIHSAMHHFSALEHVCQQISKSLKPDGLLILNEYIGPSRFQFSSRQKEIANLCLELLPVRYRSVMPEQSTVDFENTSLRKGARWFSARLIDKVRDGDLLGVVRRRMQDYKKRHSGELAEKTSVVFPSPRDVIAADPSEAIRSDEIVGVIQQYFEIVEKKDWGGNVLQFVLAGIAGNFTEESQESQALLKMLITIEDALLQCGQFSSDFAYIVARPKQ